MIECVRSRIPQENCLVGYPGSGHVLAGLSVHDLVEDFIGATSFFNPAFAVQISLSLRFPGRTGTKRTLGGERRSLLDYSMPQLVTH